jgi:ABC-2 type transport system permease protein
MAMLLIVVTTIVTAMGLAREREMGTLEQVLVTPIRPSVLLVGKMLPFVAIGIFDVLFALTLGAWLFEVPVRGSLWVLAVSSLCYLTSTLGVGLLISTVSRTQQQSFLGGFLFAMPAMLLSGAMTPIRSMPEWLQWLTYANPLRYFVEILRANMLTGAGFDLLWPRILILAGFGLVLLTVASLRFHKRVA